MKGKVRRFDVPGVNAFNYVLHQSLAGSGAVSLRSDPLARAFAQIMLDMPVSLPETVPRHSSQGSLTGLSRFMHQQSPPLTKAELLGPKI